MDYSPITYWLRKKAAADAALSFVSGALILSGGMVVVAISFAVAYVLVWLVSRLGVTWMCAVVFNQPIELPAVLDVLGAAVLVGALFAGNAWLRREYSRQPGRRAVSDIENQSSESLVHLLAYPGVSSRPLSDVLFIGPRLTSIGFDHIRKANRLWHLDVEAGSLLLALVASHSSKVTLVELSQASGIPQASRIWRQLQDIDGVVRLHQEPAGLTITSELRRELNELMSLPFRSDTRDEEQTTRGPATPDLHKLLGVSRTATLEEFEAAYRKWMRETARTGPTGVRPSLDPNAAAVKATYEAFLRQRGRRQSDDEAGQKVERVWERYKQSGK